MATNVHFQKSSRFLWCEPVMALTVAALLFALPAGVCGTETPARPTLKELKPLMSKTASAIFQEANAITITKTEVIEIGAPGWAPLTGPNNEDVFWPVKVKCTVTPLPKGAPEEVVFIFRVYQVGTAWKADTTDVFIATTPVSMRAVFKVRQDVRKQACIANLRQLNDAKAIWALENRKQDSDTPEMTDLVGPDKHMRTTPACPDGGTYSINPIDKKPKCSVSGHELP